MLVFEPCPVCLERCSTAVLSCVVMRQSGNGITEERSAAQSPEILDMSAITSRLDVAHHTLRGRYKELRACALKRAQSFPWGRSVDDGSLNDYLRMLVEAEESLSQGCWRRRADRTVPSVTASSSSATLASGVTDIRGVRSVRINPNSRANQLLWSFNAAACVSGESDSARRTDNPSEGCTGTSLNYSQLRHE